MKQYFFGSVVFLLLLSACNTNQSKEESQSKKDSNYFVNLKHSADKAREVSKKVDQHNQDELIDP